MKLAITAIIASVALASLGFAAPAAGPAAADHLVQRSPNPEVDWKTKLGWDGIVTPCDKIGETIYGPETPKTLTKRTLGGLYICPAYDWGTLPGIGCIFIIFSWNQCISLIPMFRYFISSVGPDPGTWCVLYTTTDCSWGGSPPFTYPGIPRLQGSPWGQYYHNTGSIKCWW